jgi:pectate lyase
LIHKRNRDRDNFMNLLNFKLRITLIALFLVIVSTAVGQVQLSENFDGTFTPALPTSAPSTQTDYVSSATGTWSLYYVNKYTSKYNSSPSSISVGKANNGYVITPTLNSVGTITLYGLSSGASQRKITVERSINGAAYDSVGFIIIPGGTTVWSQGSFTLNELSNNVKIKLVAYNATAGGDVRIDDIVITSYLSASTITVSTASLASFGNIISGNSSTSSSYTVSGAGLTSDIIIIAPSGFQVSTDNTIYSGLDTLFQSGGSVTTTMIYVKFAPSSPSGSIAGNIAHTSTNAATRNVSVSAVALASEPAAQSSLTFGTVTDTSIIINFSGGDGGKRIIVARSGSAVSWLPTDASAVSGVSSKYSSATNLGSGNKCVFDGTGSTVTVTELTQNTTYHFAIYEYNVGTNNSQNYNSISPGIGNQTTLAVPTLVVTPTSLSFGNVGLNTTSNEQFYAVAGESLNPTSGDIVVTAPSGFEISTTSGSGFGPSLTLSYSGSVLAATDIYIRFIPTSLTTYNGNISNVGGGATAKNVNVIGTGTVASERNTLQAEDGVLSSAYVMTTYSGYTGRGYVDIANKTGAALTFTFRRTTAGTDTIRVYYALGASSRAYAVYVNGTSVGSLSFTGTGSWTTWSSVMMMVPLQAGVNQLRFEATTNTSPNANIDRIYIGGQAATQVYRLTLAKSGLGTVTVSPDSLSSFYDAGTPVLISATPAPGSFFYHWSGIESSTENPHTIVMNAHKTEVGILPSAPGFGAFPYESAPKGFASVGAFTYPKGTTGGSGPDSQVVYVTNSDDLGNILKNRGDYTRILNFPPLTIYIIGTLTSGSVVTDMADAKEVYDISFIGVGVDAKFSGIGLSIVRSKNIIVRNIKFENSPIDGITIQADDADGTGNHIWIDHCDFTNAYDGALDISHTATYATFSWNHFYKHDKTCLMSHTDTFTQDTSMKVTYHHNWFDSTGQRHPRVRFGKAHVYNNYYYKNLLYGISSNDGADVVLEGSYFLNVLLPSDTSRDGSIPGDVLARNNIFVGCGAGQTRGSAFDPSIYYTYTIDDPSTIPALLTSYAGSGKYDFSAGGVDGPLPIQLASFVGNFIDGNSVNLEWETLSELNNFGFYVEKYDHNKNQFETLENSFQAGKGTTLDPQHYSWVDQNAVAANLQYRLKQIDNDGLVTYFGPILLNPNSSKDYKIVPAIFKLSQNYPNPFNPSTTINFTLDKSDYTTLKIYNILGKEIATLFSSNAESGRIYEINYDATHLSSGLYFYKLQSGKNSGIKKLVLLK